MCFNPPLCYQSKQVVSWNCSDGQDICFENAFLILTKILYKEALSNQDQIKIFVLSNSVDKVWSLSINICLCWKWTVIFCLLIITPYFFIFFLFLYLHLIKISKNLIEMETACTFLYKCFTDFLQILVLELIWCFWATQENIFSSRDLPEICWCFCI